MIRLLQYFKGYKAQSVLAPVFKMIEAGFELFVPLVVAKIIDKGIGGEDRDLILRYSLLLALLALLGLLFAVLAQYFASRAAVGFAARVRQALYEKVMILPASESNKLGSNRLLTLLTGDVERVQTGVNMVLRLFMRSPVVVFGAVIMAFVTDRRQGQSLGFLFLAIVPLLAIAVFAVMAKSIRSYRRSRDDAEALTLELRENLSGARVFRSFGQESYREKRMEEANERNASSAVRAAAVSALTGPLTLVIVNAGILLLLYFGALRVESGVLTTGQLVALYNYLSQILIELIKLANLIVTVTRSFASADRIAAVLSLDAAMPETPGAVPPNGELRFENVSFTYPDGTKALTDLSFTIPPGASLGIIGGTGAGKSTVISLLARFYDPTSGRVTYAGKDLSDYDLAAYREKVGMAPQKSELFTGTVRENLLWGNPGAGDDELWEALRASQAEETVREKEGGLSEPVQQGGRNFSGGQKQRLAVARALVRKPPILLLDDSASALDFATERALRKALSELPFRPTMAVVSQRASSVMHLDRILVLDHGVCAGIGTHEELLKNCAVYREICQSQFEEQEGGAQ